MINEMTNDEIEGLIGLEEVESNMLKTRKNGLTLTDNQVKTLGSITSILQSVVALLNYYL